MTPKARWLAALPAGDGEDGVRVGAGVCGAEWL